MTTGIRGSALEVRQLSENLMKTRQLAAEILAKHTGKTIDEVLKKTSSDCYFTAEEAIDFGLADSIIKKINNVKEKNNE